MILLKSEGGDAYVVPDSLKLTILVHRLVGNRTEATLLFQELCNNKDRYDSYAKAKARVLGFIRETVPKTSPAQSNLKPPRAGAHNFEGKGQAPEAPAAGYDSSDQQQWPGPWDGMQGSSQQPCLGPLGDPATTGLQS